LESGEFRGGGSASRSEEPRVRGKGMYLSISH